MNTNKENGSVNMILRLISVALAAAGAVNAWLWWNMPYLHYNWYDEDFNIILHIVLFALCVVVCIITFVFCTKNRKICRICGFVILALVLLCSMINQGFVPYTGTWVIGLISLMYLIVAFLSSRPVKAEQYTVEELTKKFRAAKIVSIVSGIVAVFSIIFPKYETLSGQHMDMDGTPGVIEYYQSTTYFGVFLYVMIPVSLIVFIIFLSRAALLKGRIKDAVTNDRS